MAVSVTVGGNMDNFQAYGEFARVYDMFQDNVDYQTWGKWLKQQLAAQGITDGLVLDLGCGTGTMTEILAEAGDDMIGVDNSERNRAKAVELGLVDRTLPLDEAIPAADLIVLATPVDSIPLLAVKVLNKVDRQVVIDMGSTKQELCEVIAQHPRRGRFVATHPMWGTEYSGPEAAVHDGFEGRTVVLCDGAESDPDALKLVEDIYRKIGMPIKYMSSEEQDTHTAYVSHISHITSFALALTVLEKEREEEHIFDLAGGGFESTVRLAKSSPETWAPIFMQNKYNVLDVLREHIHQLQIFRRLLEKDDTEGLKQMMQRANRINRIIK
mgnify:CR=1 FL=1